MAGAFNDMPSGHLETMGILTSQQAAEEYAQGDPFALNGKVLRWYIREWNNILN